MIVIVEGVDRVGKTTFINKLCELGFVPFKDKFLCIDPELSIEGGFENYSFGKCETAAIMLEQLSNMKQNVVMDRLHLTEFVYGLCDRGKTQSDFIFKLDNWLSKVDAKIVFVHTSDTVITNSEAGRDMSAHELTMRRLSKLLSCQIIHTDYNNLDFAVRQVIELATKYDFYFASPFFNESQVERESRLIAHIRNLGFTVFSPRESCHLESTSSESSRQEVFKSNCDAIRQSKVVFAVTDEKDMGTIWEAGFAYGIGKPVSYYAETLKEGALFNLMLAQSGRDVFTKQSEVTVESLMSVIMGKSRTFRGEIE